MTSDHQNTDIHWVNHNVVENRVSRNKSPDNKPIKNIADVENKDLIPCIADHKEPYNNFLVHIQRILTKRIPSLQCLSGNVPKHIKHKHSNEMRKKSKKVIDQSSVCLLFLGSPCFDTNLFLFFWKLCWNYVSIITTLFT